MSLTLLTFRKQQQTTFLQTRTRGQKKLKRVSEVEHEASMLIILNVSANQATKTKVSFNAVC